MIRKKRQKKKGSEYGTVVYVSTVVYARVMQSSEYV